MKQFQSITRGVLIAAFVLTSMAALGQTKDASVFRASYPGETHSGYCCTSWDANVSVQESDKLAPIVVTWSGEYRATTPFYAALSLNNGTCVFYGPATLAAFSPITPLLFC